MVTKDPEKSLYTALSVPFKDERAIQRTSAKETGKGYDTTGIAYQFVVNRLNEVAGIDGWGFSFDVIKQEEGRYRNDQPYWDVTMDVTVWIGQSITKRTAPGWHRSSAYGDARKGALTNGLKKAAAMFGVGREAFEGTLDDDNAPVGGNGHEAAQDRNKITEAQRKRLWVICKESTVSESDLRLYLQENFRLDSTAEIDRTDYNTICTWAQSGGFGKGGAKR